MAILDEWTETVRKTLNIDPVERDLVLDLAGDVAHGVARPAAPLTAYLVGVAVGRGADPRETIAAVSRMARNFQAGQDPTAD